MFIQTTDESGKDIYAGIDKLLLTLEKTGKHYDIEKIKKAYLYAKELHAGQYDIVKDSVILLEQLRTIDKSRLRGKVGSLGEDQMCKLDHALEVSVGLLPLYNTI